MAILAAYAVPHPPIILPEIGKGEERKIQLTINAYERAMKEAASFEPDTVVVASPHAVMYADYFHISPGDEGAGSFAQFGAPEVAPSTTRRSPRRSRPLQAKLDSTRGLWADAMRRSITAR